MRRPIHAYRVLFLVLLAGGLMLSGCAQSGSGTAAPGPDLASSGAVGSGGAPVPGASPSGASPSSVGCPAAAGQPVVVTEKDSGKNVCLGTGGRLEIYLQGTATDKWSAPVSNSDALKPVASGKAALAVGVSGGFFVGDHPGQATVTAMRDSTQFVINVTVQ